MSDSKVSLISPASLPEALNEHRLLFADAECLQRAVEGRAASDEEEEDRGAREEGQCCLSEAKKRVSRMHSCGKGLANINLKLFGQNQMCDI